MEHHYIIKALSKDGSLQSFCFTAAESVAVKAFSALALALAFSDVTRLQLFINDCSNRCLLFSMEHPFRG